MKNVLIAFALNLVAIMCVGLAGYLAIHGVEGWGWFLFVGLLCSVSKLSFGDDCGEET